MNKKKRIVISFLAAVCMLLSVAEPVRVRADEIPCEEITCDPIVFGDVTSQTRKIAVYSYAEEYVHTTLRVTNSNKTIYQKTYKEQGVRLIDIPKQKAGTALKFTLTTSYGKKGKTVTKKVKNAGTVSNKKVTSLSKPKVSGRLTNESTSVKVYAKKGTALFIKHGSKTIAKKKYKVSGYQNIPIKKQKAGESITFFVTDKKGRSKYVEKVVEDTVAPKKPVVKLKKGETDIKVSGEKGTCVYVRNKTVNGSWECAGIIENKKETFDLCYIFYEVSDGEIYEIRLVDAWGNKSKNASVKAVLGEGNSSFIVKD